MEYATLGKTGLRVSRLGFGCMRLPMKSDREVDRDKAIPLLRRAVKLGVNYFDSAVMYGAGDSQRVIGEALEDVRDKVILSTKNHLYDKTDKAAWWKNLEDSLELMRTDYIDVYHFHDMNYETFERGVAGDDGLYQEMLKAKDQGLIRHIAHSFHGSLESLKKCIDTGLFESITVQYNLLDQSMEEGIAYAAEHHMGIVIMGPVGGGRLGFPSDKAAALVGQVKSTPELALRFVLSNPNVTLALSGMSTMQMLEENVATAAASGALSEQDHREIEAAVQERKELTGLYCTGCNYCMPCPEGVDIPANFTILNLERVFGLTEHARSQYARLTGKAALCRLCGQCLEKCPQNLDIPTRLGEAVAMLDERAGTVGGWGELLGAESADDGKVALKLRFHVKNFCPDAQKDLSVRITPHRNEQVNPGSFQFKAFKPYARRYKDVELLVSSHIEGLSLDTLLETGDARTLEHLHYVLTTAPKVKGYELGAPRLGRSIIHVPSPFHPVHGADQGPKGHSFDFAAAWDDDNLYVWADVDDDLLFPAREPIKGRARADHLRLFLDGRRSSEIGRRARGDGIIDISIYPCVEDPSKSQVIASNDTQVPAIITLTPTGYCVDCAIPWEAFSQVGRPDVIGLDLMQVSHDADGNEALRMTWTGPMRRRPAARGRLLMV